MASRIHSEVSTGKAGKKGAALNAVGDEVGPMVPNMNDGLSQFQQGPGLDAVVSSPKGSSLSQRGGRGAPPQMPGGTPLEGFTFMANESRGNSPRRSAGSSTPPAKEAIREGIE